MWKDKLKKYNGKDIIHDNIGNLITDDKYSYTWEEGRRLKSIVGSGYNIILKYNDAGIRTEKNVNGIVTKYYLVGDKVSFEDNGTDRIYYTYDSENDLISMNLNGTEYYYIRNGQGDIIGLFDSNATQVVTYVYDTWGRILSVADSSGTGVGDKNPYRYRGYRYDKEVGLYYLNSRYYNPIWGRFLNADAIIGVTGELLSHNMFIYCRNNYINSEDPNGYWSVNGFVNQVWNTLLQVAVVLTVIGAYYFKATNDPEIGATMSAIMPTPNRISGGRGNSNKRINSTGNKVSVPSKKSVINKVQLPTKGKIRYVPPKDWIPSQPLPRRGGGYIDRFDNVWIKGPSRTAEESFEWDVQLSRTGKN